MSRRGTTRHPVQVTSVDQLRDLLGDEFILFCGSAVSGPWPGRPSGETFLPMVGDVTSEFFKILAEILEGGDYYERVAAGYARLLAAGKYEHIRRGTKFEEFVFRLEERLGATLVKSFLRALFLCDEGQYTANHSAIAYLLREGKAAACLTTNFDNAVEQALPALRTCVDPEPLSACVGGPLLLKLHGDVVRGTYVATTRALYSAEEEGRFGYIESLLAGKAVLVAGYSGAGDIDIAPHFRRVRGAKLVWTVYSGAPPDMATHFARYSLGSDDPADNWLLGLATGYGWTGSGGARSPDWKARLRRWFEDAPRELLPKTVEDVLAWKASWSVIHMTQVRGWVKDDAGIRRSAEDYWDEGHAHLQTANYLPAKESFDRAGAALRNQPRLVRWKGFTEWRLGRLREAINTLAPVALKPPPDSPHRQYVAECMRTYLEAGRDLIRGAKGSKRESLFGELSLGRVMDNLSTLRQDSTESELWTKATIMEIKFLMGQGVRVEELEDIYAKCRDLQLLTAAQTAACVLVTIDYAAGREAIREISGMLSQSMDNPHGRRKAFTALLYARLPVKLPIIFALLDGQLAAWPWTRLIKLIYERKLRAWRKAYNSGRVMCE